MVSNALAEFRETDNPKILTDTYARLTSFQTDRFNDPPEVGQLILRQILLLLQSCHQVRDPNYDPKTADRGTINVAPPTVPGKPPYMSGAVPEAIEDLGIRKAYSEKMAENERKHKKHARESQLEETVDRGIREARAGMESFPIDSAERKIVIATISGTSTKATLRARFLNGLASQPDAKPPEK